MIGLDLHTSTAYMLATAWYCCAGSCVAGFEGVLAGLLLSRAARNALNVVAACAAKSASRASDDLQAVVDNCPVTAYPVHSRPVALPRGTCSHKGNLPQP